uniref:Uncharacterized protein n=1 Tax=Anguilla anguilla TaxID=7936 RepID=A0A0E9X996_ANGAN
MPRLTRLNRTHIDPLPLLFCPVMCPRIHTTSCSSYHFLQQSSLCPATLPALTGPMAKLPEQEEKTKEFFR